MAAVGNVNEKLDGLPLQLLLWVTGGGNSVASRDVHVFLRMLDNGSWCRSRWARENLYRTRERHAASWTLDALSAMKRDLEQLLAGVRSLREIVSGCEAADARSDLLRLAEATARASSGILGQAGLKRERREALLVLSAIFDAVLLAPDAQGASPAGERVTSAPRLPASKGRTRQRVRCVQVLDETADVKTFRFVPLTATRFDFLPGQFTTIELEIEGELVKRSYTIASSPSRPDTLELTVKRVPGGRVSNFLHDGLRVGDELTVTGPGGKFSCELVPGAEKMLFISGGSGITPVMSMSRYLHDRADPRDVVFLYSARHESDLVFREELGLIAARSRRFRTVFTLTSAPPTWRGLKGRLSPTLLEDGVPDFRDRSVFLCGPNPFMETVREALQVSGFPMANFHAESFGGAPRETRATKEAQAPAGRRDSSPPSSRFRPSQLLGILPRPRLVATAELPGPPASDAPEAAQPNGRGAVIFQSSKREANDCASETILEVAEALGLALPSACRSGVCGTCKTKKLSGNVSMDCDDGLDASDRSAGFILACTARPLDRVVVEA